MLSDLVKNIGFSSTLRISAKALQMRREGIDVVNLSVGEPDFPTPANIKDAAKRALDNNYTNYTANDGIPELREAIVRKYRDESAADYNPNQVIVSTGAKQCLYNACIALLNPGDEVLIPLPYWVSYPHMVNLGGGTSVFVPTREENGFRLTTKELTRSLSARTRVLILNNPSNPTGSAYSPDQLRQIMDVCLAEGIFVISDEIYEKLTYDGFELISVASMGDDVRNNSLIINGFSKAYSMTGWRLGWAVGPEEVIQGMSKVQSHSTSNANSLAQYAGVEALTGSQHEIGRMRQEFERRRNYMLYRLESVPHISCFKPNGAFYLMPNMSWYFDKQFEGVPIRNSAGLAYHLLRNAHVATIPGEAFGVDEYIRLSYATSMDNLTKAMDRIIDALAQLKPSIKSKHAALNNSFTKVHKSVELERSIPIEQRDHLVAEAESSMSYDNYHEWNVNIGGVVLKLMSNSAHLVDFWTDNWYPAPLEAETEPHGVIYGTKDVAGREPRGFYNPDTRTGLLLNSAYYPQLRSMALGMADDIAGRTFNMHLAGGSCVDVNGQGISLIAPPGCGGSTHLAALLRRPEVKLHSYDGYFMRWVGDTPIADSVERKFLMRTKIVRHLPELTPLFARSKCENAVTKRDYCRVEGCSHNDDCPLDRGEPYCFYASKRSRALLDPYWIGKHVKRSTLSKLILLQKDSIATKVAKPSTDAALRILEEGSSTTSRGGYSSLPFYNKFTLVKSDERLGMLRRHYKRLLQVTPLYVVNTAIMSAQEAQEAIWKIITER